MMDTPPAGNPAILGIDCGRVIFYPLGRQVADSLVSIREIEQSRRFGKIYVISRANIFNRIFFPLRLSLLRFSQYTGIPRSNLHFCWRNKDKASLCKTLGITHFVDDGVHVLRHLQGVTHRYALNPKKREVDRYPEVMSDVTVVRSWQELVPLLLSNTSFSFC